MHKILTLAERLQSTHSCNRLIHQFNEIDEGIFLGLFIEAPLFNVPSSTTCKKNQKPENPETTHHAKKIKTAHHHHELNKTGRPAGRYASEASSSNKMPNQLLV